MWCPMQGVKGVVGRRGWCASLHPYGDVIRESIGMDRVRGLTHAARALEGRERHGLSLDSPRGCPLVGSRSYEFCHWALIGPSNLIGSVRVQDEAAFVRARVVFRLSPSDLSAKILGSPRVPK